MYHYSRYPPPLDFAVYQECSVEIKLNNACCDGDMKEAKEALDEGANPNFMFRTAGYHDITPLHICCWKGYKDIAQLLINGDADIGIRDGFDGSTSLLIAAQNDNIEVCQLLIENGVSVNEQDKLRRTPLIEAAEIGSLKIIKLLIDNNADPNMENRYYHSALSYCSDFIDEEESKYMQCAIYLIENGANPNYVGKYTKKSILHCAVIQGNMELIEQLFEQYGLYWNGLMNGRDIDNMTPLDYANESGNEDIASYLRLRSSTIGRGIEFPCSIL